MKQTLVPGAAGSAAIDVDVARTIDFMGEEARVYATPMLVRDIEMATRSFLLGHLDDGEDSVGTRIELDHLAATLLGQTVTLSFSVAEVKGRLVTFTVEGNDGVDTVCRAKHSRFVVDVATTKQRLAAKAAKAGLR